MINPFGNFIIAVEWQGGIKGAAVELEYRPTTTQLFEYLEKLDEKSQDEHGKASLLYFGPAKYYPANKLEEKPMTKEQAKRKYEEEQRRRRNNPSYTVNLYDSDFLSWYNSLVTTSSSYDYSSSSSSSCYSSDSSSSYSSSSDSSSSSSSSSCSFGD